MRALSLTVAITSTLGVVGCLSLVDANFDSATLVPDGVDAGGGGDGGGGVCEPGATDPCYDGPEGTENTGTCVGGIRTCAPDGEWGPCDGQVTPRVECGLVNEDEHCDGPHGVHDWTRVLGGGNLQRPSDAALDANGNVFVTGYSYGTMTFQGESIGVSPGIFALSVKKNGALAWAKSFGEPGGVGLSIATDPSNDVVLTARLDSATDFGGGFLTPATSADKHSVVVKLRGSDGAHLWSRHVGDGTNFTEANALATDDGGRTVVSGHFAGVLSWPEGVSLDAGNDFHMFVALLDAEGELLWARDYGPHAVVWRVAFDSEGAILMTGVIPWGFPDLGGGEIGDGSGNSFVAKLDPDGVHLWSKALGLTEGTWGRGLTVFPGNEIAIAFPFSSTLTLGDTTLYSAGSYDVAVAKLTPAGDFLWARGYGGAAKETPWDLAATGDGGVVVAGSFGGLLLGNLEVCLLTAQGTYDGSLLRLDSHGDPVWVRPFGDAVLESPVDPDWFSDIFFTVDVDGDGAAVATGVFDGKIDFGGGVISTAYHGDTVIARYAP